MRIISRMREWSLKQKSLTGNKLFNIWIYEKNEDYFGWCSADAELYSYGPGYL